MQLRRIVLITGLALIAGVATPAFAQRLGTYRWQFQPYCNVMTVEVTQVGSAYTLAGSDDLCGAPQGAALHGTAVQHPSGTIGFGLTVVYPDGQSAQVSTSISPTTLSGSWQDDQGNGGTLQFSPGPANGTPRPGAGAIRLSVASGGWMPFDTTDGLRFRYGANILAVSTGTAGEAWMGAHPAVPVVLAGRRLRLVALELCYNASAAGQLIHVSLNTATNAGSVVTMSSTSRALDETIRTDATCRVYPVTPDYVLTPNDVVSIFAGANLAENGEFIVRRTTLVLEPTSSAAAADPASALAEEPWPARGDGRPDVRPKGR